MHPDEKKRLDDAICEGLDDIKAGRSSDFREFLEELKEEDRKETRAKVDRLYRMAMDLPEHERLEFLEQLLKMNQKS